MPEAFFDNIFSPGMDPELRTKEKIRIRRGIDDNTLGPPYYEETKKMLVFLTATDSVPSPVKQGPRRFSLSFQTDSLGGNQQDLVFQIQTDSISPEELRKAYTIALDTAGFSTQFNLLLTREAESLIPKSWTLRTRPAISGLLRHQFVVAEFYDYQGYLFRKTLPYILFSLFLFSLTSLSFWLIFNNLKQQKKLAQQKNEFISNVSHELKTPLTLPRNTRLKFLINSFVYQQATPTM